MVSQVPVVHCICNVYKTSFRSHLPWSIVVTTSMVRNYIYSLYIMQIYKSVQYLQCLQDFFSFSPSVIHSPNYEHEGEIPYLFPVNHES